MCFKDRGWYPRENVEDGLLGIELNDDREGASRNKGGKIYNRILSNVLKSLRVNEDSRQQELASRILQACPELVAGYVLPPPLPLPSYSFIAICDTNIFQSITGIGPVAD